MKLLMPVVTTTLAITFAIVSGRSASLPHAGVRKSEAQNVVVLEAPASSGDGTAKNGKVDGDKVILKGKNFTSLKEMVNIINDEKEVKNSDTGETTEPFSIVVPVARNFSSLKELFEILREDDSGVKNRKSSALTTYVKGTEAKDSDYMIFFTS